MQGGHADVPLGEQLKSLVVKVKRQTQTRAMVNMKVNTPHVQKQKLRRRLDRSAKHFRRMETSSLSERTFVIRLSKKGK